MSTTKETIGPRGTVPGFRPLIGSEKWHVDNHSIGGLEGGYRPLLLNENCMIGDEYLDGFIWKPVTKSHVKFKAWGGSNQTRTRRPLPPPQVETFEAHGHVWYRHTPGDSCSVEDDARITVIFSGGQQSSILGNPDVWDWGKLHSQNTEIIGYRFPDYPAVHTSLQKQQAFAEPVEKTEQSFQPKLSDEDARDLAYMKWAREPSIGQGLLAVWDAAWQAAKLHYTAQCSPPAASADSPPTHAA